MTDPAWVALSLSRHIGGKTMRAISEYFHGDIQAALKADAATLMEIPGIGPKIADTIRETDINQIHRAIFRWRQSGVQIITRRDPAYPSKLLEIDDEPATLFVRGQWEQHFWENTVAIVGTRTPSDQARDAAWRLGAGMADQDYTVISGLARGVDTIAHQGALSIADGRTIAILGSGILNIYPPENYALAAQIMENGAIACEVHPESTVGSGGLVARNRIITGLASAVIVVETSMDGGAMYAAKRAIEQQRPLYVLDLPASGNRQLIADGATPIQLDLSNFLP